MNPVRIALIGLLITTTSAFAQTTATVDPRPDEDLEHALTLAGGNRAELERVLTHYADDKDPMKLQAAEFLIRNMDGHSYVVHAFYDEDGEKIPFNALDYNNYRAALAAMDALEAEHGPIHYGVKERQPDLENITAGFLIENIDLAFRAWRNNPWAHEVTFEAFCEYILPYRGSNEPLESWRPGVIERLGELNLDDPTSESAAYARVNKRCRKWVAFSELYYLHPTDQGFEEMTRTRRGRCEDMTNMQGYAHKAAGILYAADYTPYWPHRDNNHAWGVRLDPDGRGSHRDGKRAAKVYRKTFSRQADSLAMQLRDDEKAPPWLNRFHYIDVTDQYKDTTDPTVTLDPTPGTDTRFAYLCVFNGGEWRPIQWGRIEEQSVTFTKMGRRIAYLPAYFIDDEVVPAAAAFILNEDGSLDILDGAADAITPLEIRTAKTEDPTYPFCIAEAGASTLFVWDNGWTTHLTLTLDDETPTVLAEVPAGRLYWLVHDGSRRLERIFTIRDGRRRKW